MATVLILAYGLFLVWGGAMIIRVLGGLVIAPRPAVFVRLRQAAIWTVGGSSILVGLAAIAHSL